MLRQETLSMFVTYRPICAYVSTPFLGAIWAERGGVTRGRYFLDYLAEGGGLTVFVGKWAFVLDQPPREGLRPLVWLVFVAPTLTALAVAKIGAEAAQAWAAEFAVAGARKALAMAGKSLGSDKRRSRQY
jgi:hypothetical protein